MRASVQELLASSWLRLHNATDGSTCVKTCADWFANGGRRREAKGDEDGDHEYDDDEYEIEEEIQEAK